MSQVVLMSDRPARAEFGGCGAFGKIVATGDFIRFGVTRDFTSAWDQWLQSSLIALRDGMADHWRERYMSAPIWRFTVARGVAGPSPLAGVMMPSTDRVGRLFPLTLAGIVTTDANLAEVHFRAAGLFAVLEDIALATLDELPLEALRDRCQAIPADAISCSDPAPAVAATCLSQGAGQSLWSAMTPDGFRILRCDGLPSPATFAALLDPGEPVWRGQAGGDGLAS